MKIKLLLLDEDKEYLSRLSKVLNADYSDRLELFSFTKKELAEEELKHTRFNMVLSNENMDFAPAENARYVFGYISDQNDLTELDGYRVIYKYQKVDAFYKDIYALFAENHNGNIILNGAGMACHVSLFTSPCGGVGTSTLAAAYALGLATNSKKTFYLNLNAYDDAEYYFPDAEGEFNLSSVIHDIKQKKNNLHVFLKSYASIGNFELSFYKKANSPLDMQQFTDDERLELIKIIIKDMGYEELVIDMPFSFDAKQKEIYEFCNDIYLVSNSTDISLIKLGNAVESIMTFAKEEENWLDDKFKILYNTNTSNEDRGKRLEQSNIEALEAITHFKYDNVKQLLDKLSSETIRILEGR